MGHLTEEQQDRIMRIAGGDGGAIVGSVPAVVKTKILGHVGGEAVSEAELGEAVKLVKRKRITGRDKVQNIKRYRKTKAKAKQRAKAFYRAHKKKISKKLKKLRQKYGGAAGLAKLRKRYRVQQASHDMVGLDSLVEASLANIASPMSEASPYYEAAVRAGYLCNQMAALIGGRAGAALESLGDTADVLSDAVEGIGEESELSTQQLEHLEDLIRVVAETMRVFDECDDKGEGVEDDEDDEANESVRIESINRKHPDGVRYHVSVDGQLAAVVRDHHGMLQIEAAGGEVVEQEAARAVQRYESTGLLEDVPAGDGYREITERFVARGAQNPEALALYLGARLGDRRPFDLGEGVRAGIQSITRRIAINAEKELGKRPGAKSVKATAVSKLRARDPWVRCNVVVTLANGDTADFFVEVVHQRDEFSGYYIEAGALQHVRAEWNGLDEEAARKLLQTPSKLWSWVGRDLGRWAHRDDDYEPPHHDTPGGY